MRSVGLPEKFPLPAFFISSLSKAGLFLSFARFENITSEGYYKIIINTLKYLLSEYKAKLFAYVIMPSHIHLVLYVPEGESIIDLMRDFKKYTSIEIRKLAQKEKKNNLLGSGLRSGG